MKDIIDKVRHWELFTGIAIGMGIGIFVFAALVPSGLDMIRLYHLDKTRIVDGNLGVVSTLATSTHATSTRLNTASSFKK